MTYCGMYDGPAGAFGVCAGSVASQALNAGREPGRIRRTANRCASASPAVKAVNQALNDAESSVRVTIASRSARFAFARSAEAVASVTEDCVPHLAAA